MQQHWSVGRTQKTNVTREVCVLYFSVIWFVLSHTITTSTINILPIHTERLIQPVFDNESKRLTEKWNHKKCLESAWDSWSSMRAMCAVSDGKSESFPRNGSFEQLVSKNRFNKWFKCSFTSERNSVITRSVSLQYIRWNLKTFKESQLYAHIAV